MSVGIICKVWNIQSTVMNKGIKAHLKDSMSYILNSEKTNKTLPLDDAAISNPAEQLGRECRYVENNIKTLNGVYVGGLNILSTNVKDAVDEMMEIKEFYGKTDGRVALHGMISLPEEESDVENAAKLMQLCENTLKEIFPDHQAIFAIHTNTKNLHIHFIVNSVGLNGKKIHQDNDFVRKVLHLCINKYAAQYGFSENEEWKKESSVLTPFVETKIELRKIIDLAIEQSESLEDFIDSIKQSGVCINVGKHISLKKDGMNRAIRTYQLGSNYSKDAIIERIETKKAAFASIEVGNHTAPVKTGEIYTPALIKMKKYRDLEPEEKARIVKLLRSGRNPWEEQKKMNWQFDQIARELNSVYRVSELTSFYAKDGTLSGALEGIVEAKRKIAIEKKIIINQKRRYEPIIEIYEEMKEIEKKAYLYEHESKMEFRPEYEQYRELTRRLKEGYDKDIDEVADFVRECEERLLYAHEQLGELSREYREIKRYKESRGASLNTNGSLYELLNMREMMDNFRKGIFEADVSYIVSASSDVMLRITKLPDIDGSGKAKEIMKVAVLTRYGEKLDEFDSSAGFSQFRKKIFDCEKQYGFGDCVKCAEISSAREFLKNVASDHTRKGYTFTQAINLITENQQGPSPEISANEKPGYTFTQAINLDSVKNEEGIYYILNREDPGCIVIVMTNDSKINLRIVNREGNILREVQLPALKDRTKGGYKTIVELQRAYGFTDDMIAFTNLDAAQRHIDNNCPLPGNRKESAHERIKL